MLSLRRAVPLVCVAASLLTSTARAQATDPRDPARTGFYLLGGAAVAFENSNELDDLNDEIDVVVDALVANGALPNGTRAKVDLDVLAGFDLAAGYRLTPHVAIEGEFEWAEGDVDLQLSAPGFTSQSTKLAKYRYWLLTANSKLYALTGRVQPFALVGVGLMQQQIDVDNFPDNDETGAGFRFGGGIDLYITDGFAIATDFTYVLTAGDVEDNDVMSLNAGVAWRF